MPDLLTAADRAFLSSIIDGHANVLGDDLFERLEALYGRCPADTAERRLLDRAARAYSASVIEIAQWALAGLDAQDLIARAKGEDYQE